MFEKNIKARDQPTDKVPSLRVGTRVSDRIRPGRGVRHVVRGIRLDDAIEIVDSLTAEVVVRQVRNGTVADRTPGCHMLCNASDGDGRL